MKRKKNISNKKNSSDCLTVSEGCNNASRTGQEGEERLESCFSLLCPSVGVYLSLRKHAALAVIVSALYEGHFITFYYC